MCSAKQKKRKINYIIKAKSKQQSYTQIARDLKVSVSTVKRVWIHWLDYEEPIEIKRCGRKMSSINENTEKLLNAIYGKKLFGVYILLYQTYYLILYYYQNI